MSLLAATDQIQSWADEFGEQYTNRNTLSVEQLDALYLRNHNLSRTQLNLRFLRDLPHDSRVLEVGCNSGNQLLALQRMGYQNLSGIEVQSYALDRARTRLQGANLLQASVLDIPFADGYFDLVFTSGVLIHVAPRDLKTALGEIHRCSASHVWGFEYYAARMTPVNYRGRQNLLWKGDYAQIYRDCFPDLELVEEMRLPYCENDNLDSMFMLRKVAGADLA